MIECKYVYNVCSKSLRDTFGFQKICGSGRSPGLPRCVEALDLGSLFSFLPTPSQLFDLYFALWFMARLKRGGETKTEFLSISNVQNTVAPDLPKGGHAI